MKNFYSVTQKHFDLLEALEQSSNYDGFSLKYNPALLDERIYYFVRILEGTN